MTIDRGSTEAKPAFGLSEALTLAGIPGIAFAIVALFQAGYLAYFGVPLSASYLDAASAFAVLGGMFRIGITTWPGRALFLSILVVGIPAIPWLLPLSRTDRTLKRIPGVLIAIGLLCFAATPLWWAPFSVPLLAIIYLICLTCTTAKYSVPDGAIHIDKWFSLAVFRLMLVRLLAVPCAFFSGYKLAEVGPNGNGIREIASTAADSHKRYYLIALMRPANALGIEIYQDKVPRKDGSFFWSFTPTSSNPARSAISFSIFEKPLSSGIRECRSCEPLLGENNGWLFYRPIDASKAKIILTCSEADIPVSKIASAKE